MPDNDLEQFPQIRLARAVVSIELEPNSLRDWDQGTGFFVTRQYVLTACHNLQSASGPPNPKKVFKAIYTDKDRRPHTLDLTWIQTQSSLQAEHDIAVLKFNGQLPPDLEPLQAAMLPDQGVSKDNLSFLASRKVVIFGYPTRKDGAPGVEGRLVSGDLYEDQPLADSLLVNQLVGRIDIGASTVRLVVVGKNAHGLEGISGSPIVDVASRTVIGVQNAAARNPGPDLGTHFVIGSPLNLLIDHWPGFPEACSAIRLSPLTDEQEHAQRIRTKLEESLAALEGSTIKDRHQEKPALDYLESVLGCGKSSPGASRVGQLAEFLSSSGEKSLVPLRKALRSISLDRRKEIASQISEIIDLVIPLHIPAELWAKVRSDGESRAGLARAAGLITAEAVASLESGMPVQIERGRDGKLSAHAFKGQTRASGVPGESKTGPFDDFVRHLWMVTGFPDLPPAVSVMIGQLRGHYQDFMDVHGRPPYLIVELPEFDDDRLAWLRALADLRGKLGGHVLIVEKCSDTELNSLEGKLLLIWQEFHP
jgi:hypothetical protein